MKVDRERRGKVIGKKRRGGREAEGDKRGKRKEKARKRLQRGRVIQTEKRNKGEELRGKGMWVEKTR